MVKIMSDNDVVGQFDRLTVLCQSTAWSEIWSGLNIEVVEFDDLQLDETDTDFTVWMACQKNAIVLITGNRSAKEPHSLELTIREHSVSHSLPVITLADADRILYDATYADRAVERLLEILLELQHFCGAGRLYIP